MVELGELQGETAKKMGERSEPSSELGQGRAVKQRILPAHLQSPLPFKDFTSREPS